MFASDFVLINAEGDVIGRPLDRICVPIIERVEVVDRCPIVGEARVYQICIDYVMLRRHYLEIDVVPAFNRKFLFIIAEPKC
jgi:hypothetical protein